MIRNSGRCRLLIGVHSSKTMIYQLPEGKVGLGQ